VTKHPASFRKVTTFRIDADLLDGLQEVWERDGVAVSEQVRRAIRMWLEQKGVMKAERKRTTTRKRS
jgi:metal-responsive CopG/Arc/MetJ family transcriptional regulator